MAGHEDGAPLYRQVPHEVPEPQDAFRVEPVDRLVEHQDGGVAEQRRGVRLRARRRLAGLDRLLDDTLPGVFAEPWALGPAVVLALLRALAVTNGVRRPRTGSRGGRRPVPSTAVPRSEERELIAAAPTGLR
ncbi:hypothetical protein ABZS96_26240 [Streptomyces avermitilis]|uniref:hypothetical protein n=1 Tax=Streptomyces avermitilis TaxID=33903 RepID=UPI0033A75896